MNALDTNLQQNYGPSGGTLQPDRFAIFHFHIAPAGARGNVSITQINLRHGSQMRRAGSSWRAQPSNGCGIPIIACPGGQSWTPSLTSVPTSNVYSALMWPMVRAMQLTTNVFGNAPQLFPGDLGTGLYTARQSQSPAYNARGGLYNPLATGDMTYANNAVTDAGWSFIGTLF
ncbi:hypothetical protein MMC18_003716 [Xylographa bjoerkii]|nr:hypothetical protein [Xylographa bjoerkii]